MHFEGFFNLRLMLNNRVRTNRTSPHVDYAQHSFQEMRTPIKVGSPCSVIFLSRTHILKWYVVWCSSKNRYQKDIMFSLEIGLRAPNMITILGLLVNIIRGRRDLHDHLMSTKISTLIMNGIWIWAPKSMRIVTTASIYIILSILY